MHIKISKARTGLYLDYMILIAMYIQFALLGFIGIHSRLNKIFVLIIIASMYFRLGLRRWLGNIYAIMLMLIVVLFILSALASSEFNFAFARANFLMCIQPIFYCIYIDYLCKYRPMVINICLEKGFWLFNATAMLNIYVMAQQMLHPGEWMAATGDDPYVIQSMITMGDQVSGLFSFGATHVVCLFYCFVILNNISRILREKSIIIKMFLSIYSVVIVIFTIIISLNTDNKAFFIMLPLSLLAYYGSYIRVFKEKRGRVVICAMLLIIGTLLFSMTERGNSFININIIESIKIIIRGIGIGTSALGSNERIAIILYALAKPDTWILGRGLGAVYYRTVNYFGFTHFGQGDFGTFLVLGGIWFTILLVSLYYKLYKRIINDNKSLLVKICLFVLVMSTFVYTQCMILVENQQALLLIILAIRGIHSLKETKSNDEHMPLVRNQVYYEVS